MKRCPRCLRPLLLGLCPVRWQLIASCLVTLAVIHFIFGCAHEPPETTNPGPMLECRESSWRADGGPHCWDAGVRR